MDAVVGHSIVNFDPSKSGWATALPASMVQTRVPAKTTRLFLLLLTNSSAVLSQNRKHMPLSYINKS